MPNMNFPIDEIKARSVLLEELMREGAGILMRFFRSPSLTVATKADATPVTPADLASSDFFTAALGQLFGEPVISEEGIEGLPPESERVGWRRVWFVDPLDATQNFFAGNEEFAIVVGLVENGKPVLGAVAVPAKDRLVIGGIGIGAWSVDPSGRTSITCDPKHPRALLPANPSSKGRMLVENYFKESGYERSNYLAVGSAYRSALIASGEAGVTASYDRIGLWDLAGADAVVSAAGGCITELPRGNAIEYNPAGAMHRQGYICRSSR